MERLKRTLIVWVSIYPPLTIILVALREHLNTLPLALRTLVLTIVLVPLMTYILIPFWTRVFDQINSIKLRKSKANASDKTKTIEN
jgi:antibiotic biosynthesis monooxygenase (ABM) superfamily enzyme